MIVVRMGCFVVASSGSLHARLEGFVENEFS